MKEPIFKQILYLVLGVCIGTIGMYGIFEIYVMLNAFQNNAFILLMSLILSLFSGLLFGTLLVLKDILFPTKFKILTKIGNPLTEEDLELIWKWSNGASPKDLNIYPVNLNRILRRYCKVTLQKLSAEIGNPLTEEELELIWKWSNGSTAQELGVHRMQLNRMVRKYCKATLQKRK